MEYKNILVLNNKWDYKNMMFFAFIIALPNLLSVLNIDTPYGFKIHFFQFAIILAAILYGPIGGVAAGLMGSIYSAILMNNPYLIIGNVILGFFVGVFVRMKWNTILAVLTAFAIQLPWLVASDYYFMNMPIQVIAMIVVALLVSNTLWATIAHYTARPIKKFLN